jgi:hypothetical protein
MKYARISSPAITYRQQVPLGIGSRERNSGWKELSKEIVRLAVRILKNPKTDHAFPAGL